MLTYFMPWRVNEAWQSLVVQNLLGRTTATHNRIHGDDDIGSDALD